MGIRAQSLIFCLAASLGVSASARADQAPAPAAASLLECRDGVEMGTPFRICVVVEPEQRLHFEMDLSRAFRRIRDINNWMSEWQPSTELSKVNAAAGARAEVVRKELFEVVRETLEIAKLSSGALDPTFNALWGLYNFKAGEHRSPTDQELAERLPLIDYKAVELEPTQLSIRLKRPGMKLGLGAVGQGYAVDAVVEDLKRRGYTGGYVDGSGDTRFWGTKPDGALWMTGVRDPRDKDRVITRIYGTDFAVTSCGDDEKFFFKSGERIHHIIDPRTGRSARQSRQVTVVAPTAFLADAWDTAAFVMGPTAAKKQLEALGLDAVMVDFKGNVTITKGLSLKKDPRWGAAHLWTRRASPDSNRSL